MLTRPEQIGVATSRRITDLTLAEAFDQGNAPEQTREFLERISLTGIPQPLDYLLKSLATRIGDLVVACRGEIAVVDSRTQLPLVLGLLGLHGSLTHDEVAIPLLQAAPGSAPR